MHCIGLEGHLEVAVPGRNPATEADRMCSGTEMEAGHKMVETVMDMKNSSAKLDLVGHMALAGSETDYFGPAAVANCLAGRCRIARLDLDSAVCKLPVVPVRCMVLIDR
jgi:hypothetical protein